MFKQLINTKNKIMSKKNKLLIMSDLILLYLYDSKTFKNAELLTAVTETNGISIIDIKDLREDSKVSIQGDFFVYYKGTSKNYKGTKENLNIMKKILDNLNIEFKNNI